MTDTRKKRMSMLDSLAAAGAGSAAPSMMSTNRALRSARNAVDSHHVWELDPGAIEDDRLRDRLDPADVLDLRHAIEQNGQTVPILVRRHPSEPDRYQLVYGRRRLEAIRQSDSVTKVRALVASLDDSAAMQAQISENMARRDLSYIEKALFAQELVESGFGNQARVAEVLTVTKSSVSMAMAIAGSVGRELIEAIGAAHGIGRPRWEALSRAIDDTGADRAELAALAERVHTDAETALVRQEPVPEDVSVAAFEAVLKAVSASPAPRRSAVQSTGKSAPAKHPITIGGRKAGSVKRTAKGLAIDLDEPGFADWLEAEAQEVIEELHARWRTRAED
ncbi:plasmid partitioning protein RepB [Salipiger sp. P9]|uniref:plasmid partitioning protein RepB n=1 Tax=Salipiger pentaromativorans TaxID=2943193 RepID=UPI002157360D|nr:plasmid partitioning protein RepB [Salipiger pentaromativorans]MCR8549289.1 plasmid partitioning protein RepB [Salipiger pentaromativorans]